MEQHGGTSSRRARYWLMLNCAEAGVDSDSLGSDTACRAFLYIFFYVLYTHFLWGLCLDPLPPAIKRTFRNLFRLFGPALNRQFSWSEWFEGKPWGEPPLKNHRNHSSWGKPFLTHSLLAVMKPLQRWGCVCARVCVLMRMCLRMQESESQGDKASSGVMSAAYKQVIKCRGEAAAGLLGEKCKAIYRPDGVSPPI